MNFFGLLFLLIAHYLSGRGVMRLLHVHAKPLHLHCLSLMIGVPLISFVPLAVQLLHLPVTGITTGTGIMAITLLCTIPLARGGTGFQLKKLRLPVFYEYPFFAACLILMAISVWRCYYYPPTPRDMLSGPELIAEYAVKEKTLVNSVYGIDLHTTNNYLKSPFITGLQIIYKLFVSPFGQVWLSVLSVSFTVWLYALLRQRLNGLLAGIIMLLYICIPEIYAYSYMLLYDYSNMIFFCCGFYFLARNMRQKRKGALLFPALLFGIAVYIRTETLILMVMSMPLLVVYDVKARLPFKRILMRQLIFIAFPLLAYCLCMYIFLPAFVPMHFSAAGEVNKHLSDLSPLFRRFRDMNAQLIFSRHGLDIYGGFIYVFCSLMIADTIVFGRFGRESIIMLYGIIVVYTGLPLIGYLLPLADLMNTTKRGLFKMFPLMVLYMRSSGMLLWATAKIKVWEYAPEKEKTPTVPHAGTALQHPPDDNEGQAANNDPEQDAL